MVSNYIKKIIKSISYIRRLIEENKKLKEDLARWRTWVPPGHFYSPIPDISYIKNREHCIFKDDYIRISGIELNESIQIETLKSLADYFFEIPFDREKDNINRYYFENGYYSYADGVILYCMIRYLRPKRIVEVGSGYSSALMLDTNEKFLDNKIELTFIEPHPDRLLSLLRDEDEKKIKLLSQYVQDVSLSIFDSLNEGDILFIDSSHVLKTGSDLNFLLFNILPILKSGVYIHFHDIFYPFEYPRKWVYEGVAWNESYAIRSFLQYNKYFEIILFTSFLLQCHREMMVELLPLAIEGEKPDPSIYDDTPGASFWLKKVQ